jgi:polysaccharide chain length determinant protein (PEP-CTERM system associated)
VSFEDSNPTTAFKVVQAVLDTFMEDTLGLKRTDSDVAQRFLRSQLSDYETRLFEAEQRLAAFKQQNVGLLPGGSKGDYYTRLEADMSTLQQMQARQRQLTERRNELERQLQGEEPTYGLMGSSEGSPIDQQIAGFKAQIDELLLKYTDRHPQVVALKETIAKLEEEKRQGAKISSSVAPPGAGITGDQALVRSLDMNPVYQNLRLALSQADADLAELRGQIAAQQAQVASLRSKVEAVPEIEAELTRLSRDYDVNKAQYETLLKRLESAKISEQADVSSDNVKFRVIEPPFKPLAPVGPNRTLMSTIVLLAAIGFGLAFAIFMAQVRPTISTRDTLQSVTGIPVLGSVSAALVRSVLPWYRQQSVMVSTAIGLLMAAFVLNLLLADNLRHLILRIAG